MIGACKSIRYWQQNDGACCKTDEFEIGKLNQLNFKYDIASISMYHSRYRSLYLQAHAKHVAMHWAGTKLTHRMCSTYSCLSISSMWDVSIYNVDFWHQILLKIENLSCQQRATCEQHSEIRATNGWAKRTVKLCHRWYCFDYKSIIQKTKLKGRVESALSHLWCW